ncbi:hypothetical protein PG990_011720 [Apiospora arundinis]
MTPPPPLPPPMTPGNGVVVATGAVMPTSTNVVQFPKVSSVMAAPSFSIPSNWNHKTSIYLDKAPGYWQLPACAMTPISTIVRDMYKGCGDGGHLTSYTCFCTDSYFKARWDISTDIASSCSRDNSNHPATVSIAASAMSATTVSASDSVLPFPRAAVQSALGVFEAYCDVGVAQGIYAPSDKSSFAAPSQTEDTMKVGAASPSHDITNGGRRTAPTPPLSVCSTSRLSLVLIVIGSVMGFC